MNIVDKRIRHILFGEGKVAGQEEGRITIQFCEQYGEKKFLYPDAFEKYLKLYDLDMQMSVLEELQNKKAQLEAEKLQKQQEYEAAKSKASGNLKPAAQKKKTAKNKIK